MKHLLVGMIVVTLCLSCGSISAQESVPYFEPVECWFEIPADAEVNCGYVDVPEDRSQPMTSDNVIRLAVAVLHPPGIDPTATPLFFLQGGPGGKACGNAGKFGKGVQEIFWLMIVLEKPLQKVECESY